MERVRTSSALVTVLFTDIVGSTSIASDLGDRRWRVVLGRHHQIARREVKRFRGREVNTTGDGILATFGRPAHAIRCAAAIQDALRALGIEVRAGVHVGEVERRGQAVSGITVHAAARIMGHAGAGEVVVSGTVQELVPGSGFTFEDRGIHELRGVPGAHRLFVLEAVDGHRRPPRADPEEAARRRSAIPSPPPLFRRGPALVAISLGLIAAVATAAVVLTRRGPVRPGSVVPHQAVVRIDPATGTVDVVARGISEGEHHISGDMLVAEGGVWLVAGRALHHVDIASGTASPVGLTGLAGSLAAGHQAIWVGPSLGRNIHEVSPATLQEVSVIRVPGSGSNLGHVPIAVTRDAVFAAAPGTLIRIDPVSGRTSAHRLDLAVDLMASDGAELWMADRLAKRLVRLDPEDQRLVLDIPLQVAPDQVAPDPEGGVWLLSTTAGTLTRVSPGGEVGPPVQAGPRPVAMAVGEEGIWIADEEDGAIRLVDPITRRVVRTIQVADSVTAIAVEEETDAIWAYVV